MREGHHIYTPPPDLGLEKIRKWLVYTISWCLCKLPQNTTSIYTTAGVYMQTAPVVVYIQTAIFWGSLHIHQEMLYTSHFLFFLGPNPVVVKQKKSESGLPGGHNLSGPCGSILRHTGAYQAGKIRKITEN